MTFGSRQSRHQQLASAEMCMRSTLPISVVLLSGASLRLQTRRPVVGLAVAVLLAGCAAATGPTPSPAATPATGPTPRPAATTPVAVPTRTPWTPPPALHPTPTPTPPPISGTWVSAGTLGVPRAVGHMLLAEGGRVLVSAYDDCPQWSTPSDILIGDPLTGRWEPAGGPTQPSIGGAIVGLSDGRVLFVGGADETDQLMGTYETWQRTRLYDPATGRWSRSGALGTARLSPAVSLPNGGALVAGGTWSDGKRVRVLASAETWDPRTGAWSPAGRLSEARVYLSLVALADGRVLAVGGQAELYGSVISTTTDVFDPRTRGWTKAAELPAPFARVIALPDGGALAIRVSYDPGPDSVPDEDPRTDAVYRLDPAALTWSPAPELIPVLRAGPAVVALPDGRLFAAGEAGTRVYDPATGVTASADTPQLSSSALLLADGSVLMAGGGYADEADTGCVTTPGKLWRFVPR